MSEAHEATVRQIICDKRPEQLKMELALWNRSAVVQLIERECGISLFMRGVGNYLKRWGFTPQKPIKKAYELPTLLNGSLENVQWRLRVESTQSHFEKAAVRDDSHTYDW